MSDNKTTQARLASPTKPIRSVRTVGALLVNRLQRDSSWEPTVPARRVTPSSCLPWVILRREPATAG